MTTIELSIDGIPSNALDPWEAVGSEAISTLYSFDIACNLLGDPPDASVVGNAATLTITASGGSSRVIQGIVDSLRIASSIVSSRPPILRIRLAPRLSQLTMQRANHIFGTTQAVTVADLIDGQMRGTLRTGNLGSGQEPVLAYAKRLQQTYPARDQVAQYDETNFDFLARQTEHWGVFWFFENGIGSEQVIFADDDVSSPFIEAPVCIDWHGWNGGTTAPDDDGTIQVLEALYDRSASRVLVHDYNDNTPNVTLTGQQTVAGGTSVWCESHENFATSDEATLFARIRAEEQQARRFRLSGRSTVPRLSAGHAFQLRDHPFNAWNQNYLIVSVEHEVRVPRPDISFDPGQAVGYSNRFVIQPLSVPFRPERVTPRPRIAGLLSGRIESNTSSTAPYMDDQGRYRVRMTYDLSNSPAGFGSRWMRLAAPFAGAKDGLHFPLHPGTDVVVAYIDGDPDRPVIVGATFNPATPNVVTSAHPEQNRINFRSGMGLTAQTRTVAVSTSTSTSTSSTSSSTTAAPTDAGGNTVFLWASYQNSNYAPSSVGPTPYQWLRLGKDIDFTADGTVTVDEGPNSADGFDLATGGSGRLFAPRDLFLIRNGSATASANPETKTDANNRLIAITDTGMLLAHDGTITIGEKPGATGHPSSVTIYSAGKISLKSDQDTTMDIAGNEFKVTKGDTYSTQYGNAVGMTWGSKTTIVGGVNDNVYLALSATLIVGLKFETVLGIELKMLLSKAEFNAGYEFKLVRQKMEMAILSSIEYKPFSFALKAKKVDVDMLDTKLKAIETKIGEVKTGVSTLDTKVDSVNTKVGQLDTNVGSLETGIKDVTTSISSHGSALSELQAEVSQKIFISQKIFPEC